MFSVISSVHATEEEPVISQCSSKVLVLVYLHGIGAVTTEIKSFPVIKITKQKPFH